ncbi:hypothetical protein [Muricoccus vinaceus]|uniref:Antitoxin VbhA domain-containing protein n=1 Tax=Muricoccus vinaceus TaxID=424704 RepID=A0ABV6IU15_9PROT
MAQNAPETDESLVELFAAAMKVAQRLLMNGQSTQTAEAYIRETAPMFINAGLTVTEAVEYSTRVWGSVMQEGQA